MVHMELDEMKLNFTLFLLPIYYQIQECYEADKVSFYRDTCFLAFLHLALHILKSGGQKSLSH